MLCAYIVASVGCVIASLWTAFSGCVGLHDAAPGSTSTAITSVQLGSAVPMSQGMLRVDLPALSSKTTTTTASTTVPQWTLAPAAATATTTTTTSALQRRKSVAWGGTSTTTTTASRSTSTTTTTSSLIGQQWPRAKLRALAIAALRANARVRLHDEDDEEDDLLAEYFDEAVPSLRQDAFNEVYVEERMLL